MKKINGSGFTLIEMVIVVAIVGILAAIAVPQYQHSVRKAKEAVLREDLYQFEAIIDQYYADKGKYPQSLQSLVEEGYLRRIPKDPFTESKETWRVEYAKQDPLNPGGSPGIYDVKSGASGTGTNGVPYSQW